MSQKSHLRRLRKLVRTPLRCKRCNRSTAKIDTRGECKKCGKELARIAAILG